LIAVEQYLPEKMLWKQEVQDVIRGILARAGFKVQVFSL
jgi:hypothetical protein